MYMNTLEGIAAVFFCSVFILGMIVVAVLFLYFATWIFAVGVNDYSRGRKWSGSIRSLPDLLIPSAISFVSIAGAFISVTFIPEIIHHLQNFFLL